MGEILKVVYLLAALFAGVALWKLLSLWLWRLEQKGAARLRESRRFDAVRAGSAPMANPNESFRSRALENLGSQFSIIRKTFLSLFLLIWFIAAVLSFLGGLPAGAVSLFGAAGAVLVGIAARPLLENIIAGYVVSFSKQFYTGDTVMMDGEYGTIFDITPTHTVINLWDWRRYIVPNSAMLTKEIINYANRDNLLWARLVFHVAYGTDLDFVRERAVTLARGSPYYAGDDDPKLWIMGMGKESVECWLAMWTRGPADAWAIRTEVADQLIREFAKAGIRSHSYELKPGPVAGTHGMAGADAKGS